MSDYVQHIVDLDADARRAATLARDLGAWLLAEAIVIPNENRRAVHNPGEFAPGPRAGMAADIDAATAWVRHNGVDIDTRRVVRMATENLTAPSCPSCGERTDLGTYLERVDDWLGGSEPTIGCPACAASSPMGDWCHEFGLAVGNLSIDFYNWPPIREDFLAVVGESLAPDRWVLIHERY